MRFTKTSLAGAFILELDRHVDERGFFARSWCAREAAEFGLNPTVAQCNISYNLRRGTLRGMHFQAAPHEETKLVRCTSGSMFDVIVDIRPDSPTYLRSFSVELSAENRTMLYIPGGFAHGFQTLENNTEVFYQMSDFYVPDHARGLRWNDPLLGISWPLPDPILNEQDRNWPALALPPRA